MDQYLIGPSLPPGVSQLIGVSGNQANAAANSSITPSAGKACYVTGFDITGSGATAGSVIDCQLFDGSGLVIHYEVAIPAGVTTQVGPFIVRFPNPIRSGLVSGGWTLSVNAFGAGSTNAASNLFGFQI